MSRQAGRHIVILVSRLIDEIIRSASIWDGKEQWCYGILATIVPLTIA